jgi:hypothetical protein
MWVFATAAACLLQLLWRGQDAMQAALELLEAAEAAAVQDPGAFVWASMYVSVCSLAAGVRMVTACLLC